MTDEDELIDDLEAIGFNEYQSKAYLAAVSLGSAQFSELASESGVPQQRIYDVADELRDVGLIEVREQSGVKRAVAIPPEVALTDLKEQRIEELSLDIDSAIDGLEQTFERRDSGRGFVSVVSHENSAERHARNAVREADWWLSLSLLPDVYTALEEEIRAAVDRNVTVRLLIQSDDGGSPVDDLTFPEELFVRHRPSADRLVAADREYGVFQGVASPAVTRPYLVTRDENLVVMFQRYSEQFWAGSEEVQDGRDGPTRYLTPWHAIVDFRAHLDAGAEFETYVEGIETETGREGTWEGRLTEYTLSATEGTDVSIALPQVVSFTLETDEEMLTVGGWDATLEDIAAYGLEVDRSPT